MAKFKKLIPALCMLLISAVLMGTSTYAWFSMNTTVTASNMQVTAKSNARYLLIGTDKKIATDKSGVTNSHAFANNENSYYPIAYQETASTVKDVLGTGSDDTVVPAKSWYTANNGNSNNAIDDKKNFKLITDAETAINSSYIATYTFYLTLSNDSEDYTGKLDIAMTKPALSGEGADKKENSAVSAVVVVSSVSDDTTTELNRFAFGSKAGTKTIDSITITKSTVVDVKVFVYIDGNDSTVYSDKITKDGYTLTGSLDFNFTIAAPEAK